MNLLPPPCELGAPARYISWYPGQDRTVHRLSGPGLHVLPSPTGTGKSLSYTCVHYMSPSERMLVLTSTLGLEDQLTRDHGESGLVDIRGMGNYDCLQDPPLMVDEAPCHEGVKCELKEAGCLFYDQVRAARLSQLVSTNYAYWMHQRFNPDNRAPNIGLFKTIVLDEAHDAYNHIANFMRIELRMEDLVDWQDEFGRDMPTPPTVGDEDLDAWKVYAGALAEVLTECIMETIAGWERRRMRALIHSLGRFVLSSAPWVVEWDRHRERVMLEPLWPGALAARIWAGADRVIFSSATLTPKQLQMLGVATENLYWPEIASPYPVGTRPIILVPCVKVGRDTTPSEYGLWFLRMRQFVNRRLDRKGIIHSVSFERAAQIARNLAVPDNAILLHEPGTNAKDIVEQFKRRSAPSILISPSVTTGWDFPGDQLYWQIVSKVPFPDFGSRVVLKRKELDPTYPAVVAAASITQIAGRGNRKPGDLCETAIMDDNAKWLFERYGRFFPAYIRAAVRTDVAPAPLPLPGTKPTRDYSFLEAL